MKKITLLFVFLLWVSGSLFSQQLVVSGIKAPLSVDATGGTVQDGPGAADEATFSIGGHLFAGQYPINNPVNTGDTGIIYLYSIENNIVRPVDTTTFADLGYYLFPKVARGTYFLKARLTRGSTHFKDYFPTYYSSDARWVNATALEVNDQNIFEANINLLPTTQTLTGPASIKGFVVQATSEQGVEVMDNTEVLLFNEKMDPITYYISDNAGMFLFNNLPYGTYNLIAESTGKYPSLLRITVDQNHLDYDSVLVEALTHNPSTIEDLGNACLPDLGPVFPNPATDNINIVIRTVEPEILKVAIYSLLSGKVFSLDYPVTGIRSVGIPISTLPAGTYLLMVSKSEGHWRQVQKFVKN
jgi:hypothetical protein